MFQMHSNDLIYYLSKRGMAKHCAWEFTLIAIYIVWMYGLWKYQVLAAVCQLGLHHLLSIRVCPCPSVMHLTHNPVVRHSVTNSAPNCSINGLLGVDLKKLN